MCIVHGFSNFTSFLTISAIYMLCLVSTGLLDEQSIFLEACYLVLCTLAHTLTAIATILTVGSKYYMQYQLMKLLDPRVMLLHQSACMPVLSIFFYLLYI